MRLEIVALLSFISFSLYALEDMDRQQIQQRIQPVGKVRVQEQDKTANEIETEKKALVKEEKKEPGLATYEQYCVVCHRDGLAGAPKFRDGADWKSRTTGRSIEELLATSIKGLNAMPPKGTCVECTDTDLKAAIQYMIPKS